ncbi:MAG: FkbM family methyltransferase, partial [Acidimicrobiales bacterium]
VGADSAARRLAKRALRPIMGDATYRWAQALAMAWDIRSGRWSEPELAVVAQAVRSGEVTVDVGANYGLYAYHLSRQVGRAGKVYAFEPVAFTYQSLRLVSRLLMMRNVELVQKGCGDRPGPARFTVPVQTSGAISAGQAHLADRRDDRPGRELHVRVRASRDDTVDVVTLDEYLPEGMDVSFIKCDVEGAEHLVLRGARRVVESSWPTIVCEINPWFLEGFGVSVRDLTSMLDDAGYRMCRVVGDGHPLEMVAMGRGQEVVEDNYVFVHPTRFGRFAGARFQLQ